MIKRYKIFLASSKELEPERKALELAVKRRNELYKDTHFPVELDLVAWEQCDEAMAPGGKQSQYDHEIRNCDIFVLLFWTKMGKFTDWEFDLAVETWKGSKHKKPQIFIYEKLAAPATTPSKKDTDSLKAFKDKLTNNHKHYTGVFGTEKELTGGFWEQMELVFRNDHIAIPESATVLTDPPPPPAYFIGRDDDLNEISRRLKAGKKLMLINAEGGIGKTSLAASYWADYLGYYRLCAWLFCESSITEELKKLAPGLGIDLANMTEAQQIAALKLKLGQEAKPDFLLVLDNANDPKHIQEFSRHFGGYTWHVLITSRCHGIMPDKSQEMPIKTLPPAMARELFKNYYTENTPAFEILLDQLLQRVSYNTLLVELFAKNMKELARYGENLNSFLAGLEEKGFLLGKKSLRINTQYTGNTHKEAETTDDILNILYDFGRLDAGQTHLLVTLALLPATYYGQVFLLTLFKPLDAFETGEGLRRLSELGWLAGEDQGYRLSPVIQQLVLNKHKDKLQQYAEPLIKNINGQLKNNGTNLLDGNNKRAAPYAGLVNHIADQLRGYYFFDLCLLCNNAGVYYRAIGNWHNAFRNYKEFINISKKILDSNPDSLFYKNSLAIAYSRLGEIYQQKGDWQKALEYYEASNQLEKELYEASPETLGYKNSLAISYSKLGEIYQQKGDWQKALEHYEADLKITKEIYEASPDTLEYKNNLAISQQNLGNIYKQKGDWQKALEHYEADLKITKELYDESPETLEYKNNLAISFSRLGEIYQQKGDRQKALEHYEAYNQLEKELYESSPETLAYKNGLAISYSKLGEIYRQKGDWQKALEHYEAYNQLEKELYESSPETLDYKNGLAISHQNLGKIYQQKGDWQKALEHYEAYNQLVKELYEASPETLSYKNGLAISYSKLGEIYQQKGDWQKALEHYEDYNRLEKELYESSPETLDYKNGLAISYSKLGEIYQQNGDWQKALEHYEAYNKLKKELYEASPETLEYKNGLAVSYAYLGLVYENANDLVQAKRYFQDAQILWQEIHDKWPGNLDYEHNLNWVNKKLAGM